MNTERIDPVRAYTWGFFFFANILSWALIVWACATYLPMIASWVKA